MEAKRVAVLVDGDNIGPATAERILTEARKLGRVDLARVYGAANRPSGWLTVSGFRMIHAGAGKNGADLLLSIDAMELALRDGIRAFVIASSDGDFSHLACRLREMGCHVLGLGEAKAPPAFRVVCSAFVELGAVPAKPVEAKPAAVKPAKAVQAKAVVPSGAARPVALDLLIRSMIARHSSGGRGMKMVELAPRMHVDHGVKISTLPERTWRAYFIARPTLYAVDPRGPEAMVRFLQSGFAEA